MKKYLPKFIKKPLRFLYKKIIRLTSIYFYLAVVLFDLTGKYYRLDNCKFFIPRRLTNVKFRVMIYKNGYEKKERELIKKYIDKKDAILELGGCLGVVSCVANKKLENRKNILFWSLILT